MSRAEEIARAFHDEYERLAADSAAWANTNPVLWDAAQEQIKTMMITVAQSLLDQGVVT